MTFFTLVTFLKALSPNKVISEILGVRASTYEARVGVGEADRRTQFSS